ERIEAVADKIVEYRKQGHDIVVVVSAMSGETNRLIGLAQAIDSDPAPREMDVLLSTGEQVTIALLSIALQKRGCDARTFTAAQVRILSDESQVRLRLRELDDHLIYQGLTKCRVVVVAGF